MQIVDVPRDHRALGIAPWSLADAIARVDAGIAARQRGAEIGAPIRGLGAGGLGERRTMRVGTFQAAEIGAVSFTGAGHEKRHIGLLRRCRALRLRRTGNANADCRQRRKQYKLPRHGISLAPCCFDRKRRKDRPSEQRRQCTERL